MIESKEIRNIFITQKRTPFFKVPAFILEQHNKVLQTLVVQSSCLKKTLTDYLYL